MREGKILNLPDKHIALEYCEDVFDLEVRNEDDQLSENILWDKYGIDLHEVDKAQLAQIQMEIKSKTNGSHNE